MSEERVKFTGHDLAEALAAARRHFGVSRQELEFEKLTERKVGPAEKAEPQVEILAWRRPGGARPLPPPREDRDRGGRGGRERGGRGPGRGRGDREEGFQRRGDGPGRDRDRDRNRDRDRDRDRNRDRGGDRPRPRRADEEIHLLPLMPPPEVEHVPSILDQLSRSLIIGLDLQLQVAGIEETEVGTRVRLEGEDAPLLLEAEGEGLEAFQYLANRILQKDGRVTNRVSFDAGGWRSTSEAKLVEQARGMAEEVLSSGKLRKMPPMGPYERRLVHMCLAGMEGIKTFSTGTGYTRRLHIAPLSAPETEEEAGNTDNGPPDSETF